jgi:hypothetical protein
MPIGMTVYGDTPYSARPGTTFRKQGTDIDPNHEPPFISVEALSLNGHSIRICAFCHPDFSGPNLGHIILDIVHFFIKMTPELTAARRFSARKTHIAPLY